MKMICAIQSIFTLCLVNLLLLTPQGVQSLSIVEASISELQEALTSGRINAVQLLAKHLNRVAHYDRRGVHLNAIPVLRINAFEEAQASDDWRADNNGSIRSLIEGLPFTVKDSYMVKGLPVAAGSPAFQNLTAHDDAFAVEVLRAAGGIVLGKTNTPPMANGGMQRGLYGRAESPYNPEYLAAAMGSGSSNGCGVSTASSMAVFGMAEETVSSGRSPASNNGLVAYTPSRGMLSIRDNETTGDLWRSQPFVQLPNVQDIRPNSFLSLANDSSIRGKRIGIPSMFLGKRDAVSQPVYIHASVIDLWEEARKTLEYLGATIEEVDFPLVSNFEVAPTRNEVNSDYPLPAYYNGSSGPADFGALAWDDFLHNVNDSSSVVQLGDVDPALIFPQIPGTLPDRYGNTFNNRTSGNAAAVEDAKNRRGPIVEVPGFSEWLHSLEDRRKRDLEDWMDQKGLDFLVWPAAGDVGRAAAEVDEQAAALTWRNGVARSLGNFAIRQLGVPTVTLTMGTMKNTQMPVGLTFASKAYDDVSLLSYGYAFEQAHVSPRFAPRRTPPLETDQIQYEERQELTQGKAAPDLSAHGQRVGANAVYINGRVASHDRHEEASLDLEVYVDGVLASALVVRVNQTWSVTANITEEFSGVSRFGEINHPDASLAMVVVVATASNGRSAGKLLFV
ncbi:Amidase domain-containing protein [Fusarium keratoplasticum]|nr:Amidase domain-containing protein [Fusarium keratoplasticum]